MNAGPGPAFFFGAPGMAIDYRVRVPNTLSSMSVS